MPFSRPFVIAALLILLALFSLQRCGDEKVQSVSRSRILMGTVVEITALGEDPDDLDAALSAAFTEMERIEALMSPHFPDSDVSRLSGSETGADVSPETAEVIALGLTVSEASGGAFDMVLGRLKALWGIESESPRVPTEEEIGDALAGAGPAALRLQGERVEKAAPALAVDLGGIDKGYAVDRAIEVLRQEGVKSASVNAGGDIGLLGDKGGSPWRIGIQHPRRQEGLLAVLPLKGGAVVTSGDYERYFERDGVRYHHLFDPRTGYPARLCRSVTVVADSAALADALATAVFVLGPQEGDELLARFPGAEGIFVAADGSTLATDGLKDSVEWQ